MTKQVQVPEPVLIARLQLLLAEQRTNYALLRTGIAVFTFGPSVVLFLIATNGFHHLFEYYILSAIVVGLLAGVSTIGAMQARRANEKIRKVTKLMRRIKDQNEFLAEFLVL